MKIKSLQIENVKGIPEWSGDFGPNLTIVEGENGVGKSSLLDALKNALFGSAALASIARTTPEGEAFEPKVVVVMEGDGKKILTKTAEKTPVIKSQVGNTAAMETVKKPGEYLRTITEASADPGKFLTAPAKEQRAMLLASLPLEWNQARVDEILGEFKPIVEAENIPTEHLYPLQRVEAFHGAIFRARTGVNVDEKAKRSAADQTRRDAPAEVPEDLVDRLKEHRGLVAGLRENREGAKTTMEQGFRRLSSEAEAKRDAAIAAAKAAYDQDMAKARESVATFKEQIAALDLDIQSAESEIAAMERQNSDRIKIQTMHEQADKFDRDADSLKGKADRMTAVLSALDSFRAEMVKEIPISGLTIDDTGIKVGGVPFEQVNTATRVGVAFSIAALRLKGLPLRVIFCDNLEALDQLHRTTLFQLALAHDIQLVGAMRTEGPLKVVRS